jgi:hypothetical protein
MNDFASALSTALHEEAQEIAMSADMQQAESQLQQSIRSADRRRRVWIALAAAAALVVAAAGLTLGIKRSPAQPTLPQPTQSATAEMTVPLTFPLTPAMTAQLPHWVLESGANDENFTHGFGYSQPQGDRSIKFLSVSYMYPLGATKITHPSYAELVAYWKAIQTRGYGTVADLAATTVDGKPATTMTVTVSKDIPQGFALCQEATDLRTNTDACMGKIHNRLMHVVIVDQGKSFPPTLLWESTSSTAQDAASPPATSEFATWLATVHFS